MKVNLHIVYNRNTGTPVALTDEKYEDFKESFGICEKQNALYFKSGNFAGLVHHTDIEVDTESIYNAGYKEGYNDGEYDSEDDPADWEEWTPIFPQD